MLIQSAFDIHFELACFTPMIAMLHLHPSIAAAIRAVDELRVEHEEPIAAVGFSTQIHTDDYSDTFGTRCSRFTAPAGKVRLTGMSIVELEDAPDPVSAGAQQWPVQEL